MRAVVRFVLVSALLLPAVAAVVHWSDSRQRAKPAHTETFWRAVASSKAGFDLTPASGADVEFQKVEADRYLAAGRAYEVEISADAIEFSSPGRGDVESFAVQLSTRDLLGGDASLMQRPAPFLAKGGTL